MARTWTTPTIYITVSGVDLTENTIYINLNQGAINQEYTNSDFDLEYDSDSNDSLITLTLDQRTSGAFRAGAPIQVQVNWMDGSSRRATTIGSFVLRENLRKKVIADEQ